MNVVCQIQDPMHREYLHHIFEVEDGAFRVTRDTDLGKFICAMVRTTEFPVEQITDDERAVYFKMPHTSAMPSLFKHFCHISSDDQRKVNDFLISKFNQDYIEYYYIGKSLGMKQKDVILNFILSRKLISKIGDVEQLKKRAYRAEERALDKMLKRLRLRVQRQSAIIKKTILEISQYQ